MKKFYINLDSAVQRRNKFIDTDFKRWRAIPREEVPSFIDNRMISMPCYPKKSHLARCGCFYSHIKLLEFIVNHRLDNTLIVEDDAIQIHPLPNNYPDDGIIYVGGFIYNKKMMNDTPPIIEKRLGINLCPDEFRILGTVSYIIPRWQLAFDILNKIYSQKRYKAIDIMYGNIGAKQYFNYPGSFREEGDISQITPNKTKIQTEDYEFISMKKYNAKSKSI